MIRRDHGKDGRHWLLIPQMEHAHLSGQLAEKWGTGGFEALEPRGQVLTAIYHHDDGWQPWDSDPDVDPLRGVPLAFSEMPLPEALAIWRRSIAAALQFGPLSGYIVAGHFGALLRRFDSWRSGDAQIAAEAVEFLDRYAAAMSEWLSTWQASAGGSEAAQIADRGVRALQFFDAVSLWLCCAQRDQPETMTDPGGQVVTFAPVSAREIVVSPWPLSCASLSLEISGRVVAARYYSTRDELAREPSAIAHIEWGLRPTVEPDE